MRSMMMLVLSLTIVACGADESETGGSSQDVSSPVEIEVSNIQTAPSNSYEEARDAAVIAIGNAAKKGHAWSTSDQLLQDAAEAAAEGEGAQAIAFADEARIQAELATAQADREAIAWRDNVISK